MLTRERLRALRNDLPMEVTLHRLDAKAPYFKSAEGRIRFQCPHCGETLVTINPRNNLAHCFGCGKNLNNIDLLLQLGYRFQEAAALLQEWLRLHNKEKAGGKTISPPAAAVRKSAGQPLPLGAVLRQEFGNRGPSGTP